MHHADPPPAPSCRIWALLACAGQGLRAAQGGADPLPKQYRLVAGLPVIEHSLRVFAALPRIAGTLVVVAPGDSFLQGRCADGVQVHACGGSSRAQSVRNGLTALLAQGAQPADWVLVHDAARCLLLPEQVDALIDACLDDAVGGLLAIPLPDTLKQASGLRVSSTVDRSDKWLAQTPQMFRLGLLQQALAQAGESVTDEASAIEAMGLSPRLVRGSAQNFKLTYAQDFALAQAVLESRARATDGADAAQQRP